MSDKNTRSVLKSEGAPGGSHIFFKGRLRHLDDADVKAILDKNVVNPLSERDALGSALRAPSRSTAVVRCRGAETLVALLAAASLNYSFLPLLFAN
jgi:hypothetical protein